MALTSSVGLLAMFLVDFADLLYIAQLGDASLTAAMGFAATVLFFGTAVNIGLMIAVSALGARRIGQGDEDYARRYLTNVLALGMLFGVPLAAGFFVFAPDILALAGADGDAQAGATAYIRIVAPSLPLSIAAMICSGFLRAHGAARLAMNITLTVAAANAILDPIFIFGFGLGIKGAAIATACAALLSMLYAVRAVIRDFGGFHAFDIAEFRADLKPILTIMAPAVLTNLATPVGGFISYRFISDYPDNIVAGYAVMGRIVPLAFCLLFSLSGSVGPIIGQNYGAGLFDRMRDTVNKAMIFALGYTLLVWPLLLVLVGPIADLFKLGEDGHHILWMFALVLAPLFLFNGMLFVSNAVCNNLDRPHWSTLMNWARNILGTLPFLWLGEKWYGLDGLVIGPGVGGILFGLLGFWLTYRIIGHKEAKATADPIAN